MSTDHQAYLFDTFQCRAPLFHEVCHGRPEPLLDVWEVIPTWERDLQAARCYAFQVMEYIWASIPCLLQSRKAHSFRDLGMHGVVVEHLSAHNIATIQAILEGRGARLIDLPPYAPDLAPIEHAWSKITTYVRGAQARTREALELAIQQALTPMTSADAHGWFTHC